MEDLYLVFGCFGRIDGDFITCSSTQNKILLVSKSLTDYNKIVSYFDSLKLYDKPCLDTNAIRHCIFNLQSRFDQKTGKLWPENKFRLYENFIQVHKTCGLFLQLRYFDKDHSFLVEEEEESVIIEASEEKIESNIVPFSNKILRGRR